MKIGLLTQWYPPEPGPASLPGELAQELVKRGHDVQVVTGFPNYPEGQFHSDYRIRRRMDEVIDGVKVRRVALYPSHDASALGRMANYASFAASATASGVDCLLDCDVVWVSNSPPTMAAPMRRLKRAGVPMILHVLDVWPDNLIASGMAGGGAQGLTVIRMAEALTRSTYECAERILTISPGVVNLLESRGVAREKLDFAPLWANERVFKPMSGETKRREIGVSDSTVVILYAGAIGATQDLDTLVDALSSLPLQSADAVECWVLGSGVWESSLRDLVRNMPSTAPRVRLLGRRPMDEMPAWTAASDICYVGLRPDDHARLTLPSKIQTAMAMGKPLLASVPGDVDQLVRQHRVGFSSAGEGRAALETQITVAASSGRGGLAALGRHAREVYVEHFSLTAGVDLLESLMAATAGAIPGMTYPAAQDLVLQPALRSDIPVIVDAHMRSFPGFFLTFLGPSFLRLFYDGLRTHADAQLLVARSRGEVVGFVGGVLDEAPFFSDLKHDQALPFVGAALAGALRDPKVIGRLWRARRRGDLSAEDETPATLLSIGVTPDSQGSGVGRALIATFREWLSGAGVSRFKLTTDALDNESTITFYEKNQMSVSRHLVTPEGRQMLEFVGPTTLPGRPTLGS